MPVATLVHRPGRVFSSSRIVCENHAPLFGIVGLVERGHLTGLLELIRAVHEQRRVAAVVDDQRRARAVRPDQRLLGAPPVVLERLAFPREHGDAARRFHRAFGLGPADGDGRGRVVLRREDVARHPADVGAELGERLDQHRGLNGHVQRTHDARAGQRLLRAVALAEGHQARHLLLGQPDFFSAPFGEVEVGDFVGLAARLAGLVVGVFGSGGHGRHDDSLGNSNFELQTSNFRTQVPSKRVAELTGHYDEFGNVLLAFAAVAAISSGPLASSSGGNVITRGAERPDCVSRRLTCSSENPSQT